MAEKQRTEGLDDIIRLISDIEAALTRVTKILEQEAPRWRGEVNLSKLSSSSARARS